MQQAPTDARKAAKQDSDAIRTILVRSTNWLGDAVMTLPALERLRQHFPKARISLLAKPGLEAIFQSAGVVDEIIQYDRHGNHQTSGTLGFLRLVITLRKRKFDAALIFQGAFEAALMAWLAGIPRRIGFATQGRGFLLTDPRPQPPKFPPVHETRTYLALVDVLAPTVRDATEESQPRPTLKATPVQQEAALRALSTAGPFSRSRPLIILNPGATNSRAKRWPINHFARLADELARSLGAQIAIVGSRSEQDIASEILARVQHESTLNLSGKTDLSTLIGVLSIASAVISNDTGTAHVSAALGVPTLTLFGPTNEFETAPLGPAAEVVRFPGIECERCMLRECPIDHRCLERLTPEAVLERAQKAMGAVQ